MPRFIFVFFVFFCVLLSNIGFAQDSDESTTFVSEDAKTVTLRKGGKNFTAEKASPNDEHAANIATSDGKIFHIKFTPRPVPYSSSQSKEADLTPACMSTSFGRLFREMAYSLDTVKDSLEKAGKAEPTVRPKLVSEACVSAVEAHQTITDLFRLLHGNKKPTTKSAEVADLVGADLLGPYNQLKADCHDWLIGKQTEVEKMIANSRASLKDLEQQMAKAYTKLFKTPALESEQKR